MAGHVGVYLCLLVLVSWLFGALGNFHSAVLDKHTGKLIVKPGLQTDCIAWANFTDDIKNTGWAYLEVNTSSQYNDSLQAYAAGAVEAAATSQLLYEHWMNTRMGYCGPFMRTSYCEQLEDYIIRNFQWMEQQMENGDKLEYWHQVRLVLLQLRGLEDSYNDQIDFPTGSFSINPFGFLLFQMGGDLKDLEEAFNKSTLTSTLGTGSCSALIKLLPGNKDLLVSHVTWKNYQGMLRIMKKYSFAYRTSPKAGVLIPGSTQAFSSYPGSIFSGDDFYILSSGLVILETTVGNHNPALWKFVKPSDSVMSWLRNIVANRLAESSRQWADIFSKYNSGTYNNQWMILDYKLFTPGEIVENQLFVLLDQIPGLIKSQDKSKDLFQMGYWASYNIPYFPEVFNKSGWSEQVERYGDWFSFDMCPRAQIFRRNQSLVTNMESMIRLMRYNNFKEDPLSKCPGCDPPNNAENAISARSDLNPSNGTYPFSALMQRSHGSIDMKVTSFSMFREYQMLAISGPTWDQVPAFRWSKSPYSELLHMGHPDLWAFPTVFVCWA